MDPNELPAAPEAEQASTQRTWIRRFVGTLLRFSVALVVALVIVEVAVRALGLGVPPRGPDNKLPLRHRIPAAQAPGLVDSLRPNSEGKVLYPGFKGQPERWVEYRINADGFRDDRSYSREVPAETFRIVMLGDSVTYGTGVAARDTLPKQLESALEEARPEDTIEVMNCGVYAHNTGQQVAWFEYAALEFEPDLVLIVSTITDASGRGIPQAEHEPSWEQLCITRLGLTSGVWEGGHSLSPAYERMIKLRSKSRLADLLAHRGFCYLRGRMMKQSYGSNWAPGSPGHAYVERALRRARSLAREHDFELVVALYPTLTSLDEDYPYSTESAALEAICASLEIPFLDLFEPLNGLPAKALHAHAHDRHPNATAHGLVARWLASRLEPFLPRD